MKLENVVANAVFVVVSPRMPSAARSTGKGSRVGTRIEKVEQVVLTDDFLRPLACIKSQVRRQMMQVGTQVESINAWLVPKAHWLEAKRYLDDKKSAWEINATALESNLDVQLEALVQANPDQEDDIRGNALTQAKFKKATRFVYGAFTMTADQIEESGSLAEEIGGMATQVIEDLCKLVADSGKNRGGKPERESTLGLLRTLQAKAEAFAFVDAAIGKVANCIAKVGTAIRIGKAIDGARERLVVTLFDRLESAGTVIAKGLQLDAAIDAVTAEDLQAVREQAVQLRTESARKSVEKTRSKPAKVPANAVAPVPSAPAPPRKYNPVCV